MTKKNRRPQILTENLKVRFSAEDFGRLQKIAKSTGVSVGEIVRRSCATTEAVTIEGCEEEHREELKKMRVEIAKVGNNLNQLARWCNTHPAAAPSVDVLQVLQQIESNLRIFK